MLHRRTASKRIVTDGRVLGEIDQVKSMLVMARGVEQVDPQGLISEVPRLERRLLELSTQAAESSLELVFQAIPAEDFDELIRLHPPSPEQLEQYREQVKSFPWVEMPEMNPKTMAPELVAASLVEPKWSRAEVNEFWRSLSRGGQAQIWDLVRNVQTEGADLPFFNAATGTTSDGGEPSTTPANGASPSQSS